MKIKTKLKLRGKLILSMGILTFLAVFLLSLLSNVSLRFAYNNVIAAEKEKLDQIIQSQVAYLYCHLYIALRHTLEIALDWGRSVHR